MPYTANIPQAPDIPAASQPLILENFIQIDAAVNVDHVPFNDGTGGQGKHQKLTFPNSAAAPAFAAGEIGIYNNNASGFQELYIKKPTVAAVPFTAKAADYTYLPSGILIRWGNNTWPATGSQKVYVCTTPPYFTTVYHVQMTTTSAFGANRLIYYTGVTVVAGVRVELEAWGKDRNGNNAETQAYYLIIGV